jgi:lipopolysaccharide transport system permease protein
MAMDRLKNTEILGPNRGLFDVRLRELWRYKDLIFLFVRRDFVAQYKQTILGPLWFVIQPVLTALMFFVVFGKIASIPTQGIHPFLFYFTGLSVWGYFSDCFTKTSNTFVVNAGLFGKVYFPRLAVPISIVISGLVKLFIHFALLAILLIWFSFSGIQTLNVNLTLGFLPLYILLMALLGLGMGILFSSLTTKYKDLSFLLTFGIQLLMYATPIIYPLSYTSGVLHEVLQWNPLTSIVENLRFSLYGIGAFDGMGLLYTASFTAVILFGGVIVFNRVEQSFMDTV